MRKLGGVFLCFALMPHAAVLAQSPRDTPPPAIEMARRERDLRAAIAAGTATRETYLELASLMSRQGRTADLIESGAVANARILRSIPVFDQAALAAVSRWRYTPTDLNGRPLSVIMTLTVVFTLQ